MNRLIIKSIILTLVLLISCSNQEVENRELEVGIYAWKEQSQMRLLFYRFMHNTAFVIGDTLRLSQDNEFSYSDCGNYGFGKYEVTGDTLYLRYDSSAAGKDDVMHYYDEGEVVETYYIDEENTLINRSRSKYSLDDNWSFFGRSELHYVEDTTSSELN